MYLGSITQDTEAKISYVEQDSYDFIPVQSQKIFPNPAFGRILNSLLGASQHLFENWTRVLLDHDTKGCSW